MPGVHAAPTPMASGWDERDAGRIQALKAAGRSMTAEEAGPLTWSVWIRNVGS